MLEAERVQYLEPRHTGPRLRLCPNQVFSTAIHNTSRTLASGAEGLLLAHSVVSLLSNNTSLSGHSGH